MREDVERVRELDAAAADIRMIRAWRARLGASSATGAPAFETTWPSTVTWPARISARARSRDGARPRSTSSDVEPRSSSAHAKDRPRSGKPATFAFALQFLRVSTQSAMRPSQPSRQPRVHQHGVRALDAFSRPSCAGRSRPNSDGIGRLVAGGVLAGGLARARARCPRRRGCRRRSETRGRARSPQRVDRVDRASSSPPAMIAPLTADARISAPVFRGCIARSAVAVERDARGPAPGRRACRSIACPPTMPARARRRRRSTLQHAQLPRDDRRIVADRLRARAARTPRPAGASPARIAMPSPYDDVQRRPSAAQRVVVHRRQIVVDQRVGVDQLDRARGRQRERRRRAPCRVRPACDAHRRPPARGRPQPLAAGEHAVAHRRR